MHHWKCLFFASFIFLCHLQANWTTSPNTIDSGSASSSAPLVVDSSGNVTSSWLENYTNVSGDDPQAAFFSISSQQWLPPQPIIQAGAGLATPQLIVDSFGTVTLVWLEFFSENANNSTLFASRSIQGGPWTTPTPLNSLPADVPTNAQIPVSMVVDTQGNVTIAWMEQDITTTNYAIGTARFTSDINASPTLYPFLDGISPSANNNIIPQLVVDQLGYVTAVWQEQIGSGFAVQAARLSPSGSAWSTAVNLNGMSLNANGTITPKMVVDASGIVTVVWQEKSGSQFSVQAARFTPGAGGAGGSWITYPSLAPALSNANGSLTPQIVVDNHGSVTIAAIDANFSVWPSSFAAGSSSWTFPSTPLNSGTAFSLTPLSMVVDQSGVVTILWLNNVSGLFVQAARGFSTSWSAAANLDAGNADGNTPILVVIDAFGTVTTSWMEGSAMQAARFLSGGSSWSDAATLDNGNLYNLILPRIVVGPSGAVTVVWQEALGQTGPYAIQAARFTPGETAWTPPATLDNGSQSPNAFFSSMTQQINMVVDPFDNVTVTWLESALSSSIVVQSARFSAPPVISAISPNQGPTTGGTSVIITGNNFNDVSNVLFGSQSASFQVNNRSQITAISPPGNAGIVDITVVTSNGTSLIGDNDRFTYFQIQPSPPLPPTNLKGFQIIKRHGKHKGVFNILTWNPPSQESSPIIAYRIYEGFESRKLIGIVPNIPPLRFVQHLCKKKKRYIYTVVSVDSSGQESTSAFVIIRRCCKNCKLQNYQKRSHILLNMTPQPKIPIFN